MGLRLPLEENVPLPRLLRTTLTWVLPPDKLLNPYRLVQFKCSFFLRVR